MDCLSTKKYIQRIKKRKNNRKKRKLQNKNGVWKRFLELY